MCHLETIVISAPSFRNERPSHHIEQIIRQCRRPFQPTVRCLIQIVRLRFCCIKQWTAGTRRRREKIGAVISKRQSDIISNRKSFRTFRDFEERVISKLDSEMTIISKRIISNRISSVISKRQPQGIGKPAALRAFLTSFYSFSFSHISKMPCGTALSVVASEPFLSHLRRG